MTDNGAFDWSPFAGDRWTPNEIGDEIVGKVTKITVQKGQRGDVPVVSVLDKEGVEREVWPPMHLKQLLAEHSPQVGDMVAMKLIDFKNTGQPQPMKMFDIRVKKAEAPEPTPVADTDPF